MAVHRLAAALLLCAACVTGRSREGNRWTGSWGTSVQLTETRNLPPAPGLAGNTLRQFIKLSIGGRALRLRLSNTFGDAPLTVRTTTVMRAQGPGTAVESSMRPVTFAGSASVTIPPGAMVTSDPVELSVEPLSHLAIDLAYGEMSNTVVTGHPGSRTTSFLVSGTSAAAVGSAVKVEHWYTIAGIDVVPSAPSAAVVTLGNSITDGRGSTSDGNNRWPDNLARRLSADPRTRHVAVLNAGIGGNAVVRGGLGPTALARFDRDVLQQAGARWVIVLEGVNDIGGASSPEAAARTADELIDAYQQMIRRARAAGIRIYGATILPFGTSFYDSPAREAARVKVNQWIRTSGAWDAVIDFDAAMRDPAAPTRLRPEADSGDHLHPNEVGYRLMGEAIRLELFVR